MNVVSVMEIRDGKIVRERNYYGEPWEPPAWRAQWVEPMETACVTFGRPSWARSPMSSPGRGVWAGPSAAREEAGPLSRLLGVAGAGCQFPSRQEGLPRGDKPKVTRVDVPRHARRRQNVERVDQRRE